MRWVNLGIVIVCAALLGNQIMLTKRVNRLNSNLSDMVEIQDRTIKLLERFSSQKEKTFEFPEPSKEGGA